MKYLSVLILVILEVVSCQENYVHQARTPGARNQAQNVNDYTPITFPENSEERMGAQNGASIFDSTSRTEISDGKQNYDPITGFSLGLFKEVTRGSSGNMAVCPISVSSLLALLMQGSSKNTLKQLENVLQYNQNDAARSYGYFYQTKRSSKNELSLANAVMIKQGIEIVPKFKQMALRNFHALFDSLDYKNLTASAAKLNNWISQQTRGKINNLFRPDFLQDQPQVVLVNAVFFKGVWKTQFNPRKTVAQPFNVVPGQEDNVPFMYQSGNFPAGMDQRMGAKWVELPFEGEDLSMLFIIPTRQHELNELINKMSLDDLKTMINTRNTLFVNMAIPKFNISADTILTPSLIDMGLGDVFSSKAEINGISNGQPLMVQKAVQRVVMSVDEQGAKAAAGTVLTVNTLSLASIYDEFYFTANQPFLAILVDRINLVPLFMARITNPSG